MTTINYTFADGRTEEIEVTEEFALQYALLEDQQKRYEEREKKRRKRRLSFDRLTEQGSDLPDANAADPLEVLLEKKREHYSLIELSDLLTDSQWQVMKLYYVAGYSKSEIAQALQIDKSTVRECLQSSLKKFLKYF